jgi:NB-ARC domain
MLDRLDWADFVLVVCTETGKGADWEGNLIALEMYDAKSKTTKFAPVFFATQDEQFIPEPLRGHTHYLLNSEDSYAGLYAFLTGQAGARPGQLGSLKTLAREQVEPLRFGASEVVREAMGKLYGVPDLPPHYLPRAEDNAGLKQKLLAGDGNAGITGQSSAAVGVQGMGGIGKTVLATALAHDPKVRKALPEGTHWVTLSQSRNLLVQQGQLVRNLTGSEEALTTKQEGKDALREALEGRRILVILDDVWKVDDAEAFLVDVPPARLLITTRNREVLVGLGAEEHWVDALSPSDALRVLAEWTGEKRPDRLALRAP